MKNKLPNAENKAGQLLMFILLSTVALTLTTLYLSSINLYPGLFLSYFRDPRIILLTAWPIAATLTLFLSILAKPRLAFFLTGLLWHLLALASKLKLTYRHESLKLLDYDLVIPAFRMAPRYFGRELLLLGVLFIVFIVVLAVISVKIKVKRPSLKKRLALVSVSLVGILLTAPVYADDDLAKAMGTPELNQHIEIYQTMRNGYGFALINQSRHYFALPDEALIRQGESLLKDFPEAKIPENQRVNICVLLLESFKDFSDTETTLQFANDPYAAWHELESRSLHGHFIADVYGGGTIHSEMSVLGGYDGRTHQSLFRKPRSTYAHTCYRSGYRTEGMHPNTGYFYNRKGFYPQMGFQAFYYQENFFHHDNNADGLLKDEVLFKQIYQRMVEKAPQSPYFNFTATLANHGPYYAEKCFFTEPAIAYQEGMNRQAYNTLNNYLGGLNSTGEALSQLCADFNAYSEPIIVVAFGDHSPALEDEVYDLLAISTDENTEQGYRNRYETPYLIWANEQAKMVTGKSFEGILPDTDPNLLLAHLFRYLGWQGDPYQNFLIDHGEHLTVNKERFHIIDGIYHQQLPEKWQEEVLKRKAVEAYVKAQSIKPINADK